MNCNDDNNSYVATVIFTLKSLLVHHVDIMSALLHDLSLERVSLHEFVFIDIHSRVKL